MARAFVGLPLPLVLENAAMAAGRSPKPPFPVVAIYSSGRYTRAVTNASWLTFFPVTHSTPAMAAQAPAPIGNSAICIGRPPDGTQVPDYILAANRALTERGASVRPRVQVTETAPYKVAPHFVVCVVNDSTILRCVLSPGAKTIPSDVVELHAAEPSVAGDTGGAGVPHVSQRLDPGHVDPTAPTSLTGRAAVPLPSQPVKTRTLPIGFIRTLLYSPNLVADDYPHFAWDCDLEVDGQSYYIGCIKNRCQVTDRRFVLPHGARRVQLKLSRLRLAPVKSPESEALAQRLCELFQDPAFNPRNGSLALQMISEEANRRYPNEYRKVVGGEHLGSFRAFIVAHDESFSIFHYRNKEITNRRLNNVTAHDERVAIRKEVRDSSPPMLPSGHENEQKIIDLLTSELKDKDSSVHVLLRKLSGHDVFRIGMSAAFSTLMHWLQKHREVFCWSTDPQSLCTIGLVKDNPVNLPAVPGVTTVGPTKPSAETDGSTAATGGATSGSEGVGRGMTLEEQDALAALGIMDDDDDDEPPPHGDEFDIPPDDAVDADAAAWAAEATAAAEAAGGAEFLAGGAAEPAPEASE